LKKRRKTKKYIVILVIVFIVYWLVSVLSSPTGSFVKRVYIKDENKIFELKTVFTDSFENIYKDGNSDCSKYKFFLTKIYCFKQFGGFHIGYNLPVDDGRISLNFKYPVDKGIYDLKVKFDKREAMGFFSNQPITYKLGDTVNVMVIDKKDISCKFKVIIESDVLKNDFKQNTYNKYLRYGE